MNRNVRFGRVIAFATVGVATIVVGAATAPSYRSAPPGLNGEVAVVVESGGNQAVAVLSASARGWRVVSRISVRRGIRSIAWSPTGRKLAVTTAGGNLSNELRVVDVTRGAQRIVARAKRADPAAFFGSLAWSPRGRWIAVTRSMSLYGAEINILDATTGSLSRSFHVFARHDSALAWSTNGASLYFAEQKTNRSRPRLRKLVVATGRVLPVDGVRGLDPSVRVDGAESFTADDGIRIVQSGRERRIAGSKRGDRFGIWSKRGELLLAERPASGCPRYANPQLCSHVVVLTPNHGEPRYVLTELARNPAAR